MEVFTQTSLGSWQRFCLLKRGKNQIKKKNSQICTKHLQQTWTNQITKSSVRIKKDKAPIIGYFKACQKIILGKCHQSKKSSDSTIKKESRKVK